MKKANKKDLAAKDDVVAVTTPEAQVVVDPNVITWPEHQWSSQTWEEHHKIEKAAKDAFCAEHKCVIVHTYLKVPPQDFQDLMIRQLTPYYAIRNPRFIKNILVADWVGDYSNLMTESMRSMKEGIEYGYKCGLGPTKAYSITYNERKLRPAHKGKTEEEIRREFDLGWYDPLPTQVATLKTVTETFHTWEEADKRRKELRPDWNEKHVFPAAESTEWHIDHDKTKDDWF